MTYRQPKPNNSDSVRTTRSQLDQNRRSNTARSLRSGSTSSDYQRSSASDTRQSARAQGVRQSRQISDSRSNYTNHTSNAVVKRSTTNKKKKRKIKKGNPVSRFFRSLQAWQKVLLAIVAVVLAIGLFYFFSALSLHNMIKDYKHQLCIIAECAITGDNGKMEAAGIQAEKTLSNLESCSNGIQWKVLDFIPAVKEDRENVINLVDALREMNDSVLWTAIEKLSQTSINSIKEDFTSGNISSAVEKTSIYSELIKEINDPIMKFVNTFDSTPTFNIGLVENEIVGYRYPIRVLVQAYPMLLDACTNIIDPAYETSQTCDLTLPEDFGINSLTPEIVGSLKTYSDLVGDLFKPVQRLLENLSSLQDIEQTDAEKAFAEKKIKKYENKRTSNIADADLSIVFIDLMDSIKSLSASGLSALPKVKELYNDLVDPLMEVLDEYPPSEIIKDKTFDAYAINAYIDLAEEIRPMLDTIKEYLVDGQDSGSEQIVEICNTLTEKVDSVIELYDKVDDYFPLLKEVLKTDGKEHLYLILAQNSSEIRACGGFPGSVGQCGINSDGYFYIADFKSVYNTLPWVTPYNEAWPTTEELDLFDTWVYAPRDAGFNPDFQRVANITQLSFESKMLASCDGVISVTPAVVQKLMALCGEITLSDGTVLNSDNATKVLQYDLYFKYFTDIANLSITEQDEINQEVDALFAEAASEVINNVFSSISLETVGTLVDIIDECKDDRTLMIWLEGDSREEVCEDLGIDGGLNDDPENPEIGVYYSCATSSKLGIFVSIENTISDATINKDGTRSYEVTSTFTNHISEEEQEAATYIIGTDGAGSSAGTICSFFHLFAPAGGTITDVTNDKGYYVSSYTYEGLDVAYLINYYLKPGASITFTYTITTAEDVTTVPTFSQTPTLQDYIDYKD